MSRIRTGIAAAYLALCLVLGGASAAGAIGNAALQLLAAAILVFHVWTSGAPLARPGRWLVGIFLAFVVLIGVQLVPLPPSLWTALPQRDVVIRSLALIGVAPGSMPLSLDPRATAASMLWLLPPAAMFLLATRLTRDERSTMAKVLLAVATISIALGAFQLFGGGGSPLYFYAVTNANRSVGFFSNANHVATLMLCSLPFAAMFMARAAKTRAEGGAREGRTFIYAAIAAFIAIGIAINGSLAAYAMLIPVAAASLILFTRSTGKRAGPKTIGAVAVALVAFVGISFLGPLSDDRFMAKFTGASATDRNISIPTTIEAARDYFPIGSGLGTFREIYRTYEPIKDVSFIFVNHAHNDYAEIALELGLAGLLIVLGFIAWWGARTFAVWRGDFNGAALARAGSIAIGVVIVHSIVDYPIRTSAIAAVVALAAGFMIPAPAARSKRSAESTAERRDGRRSTARNLDANAA